MRTNIAWFRCRSTSSKMGARAIHLLLIFWVVLSAPWLKPSTARADTTSLSGAVEITSLPCTLSAAGVYFISQNLSVTTTNVNAITVNADGVTLDLNGHTISNVGAGLGVTDTGIYAPNVARLTVRNGVVRGFTYGVYAPGGSYGHLVEDMKLIGCTGTGVRLESSNSIIRRCQAYEIGGSTQPNYKVATGFMFVGSKDVVVDCDVSALLANGTALPYGIFANGSSVLLINNRISSTYYGVFFASGATGKFRDNLCADSVSAPYNGGTDAGNN